MSMLASTYVAQNFWPGLSILSALVIMVSSFADWRRTRRKDINAVGFMPWTAITLFAVLALVISIALVIKGV